MLCQQTSSQADEAAETWKIAPNFNLPNADGQLRRKTLHGLRRFPNGTRCADFTPRMQLASKRMAKIPALRRRSSATSDVGSSFMHPCLGLVELPAVMHAFVGMFEKGETHLHVESARALGDGVKGRVRLEGGGGAEDETGNGELHFDISRMVLKVGYDVGWVGRKVRKQAMGRWVSLARIFIGLEHASVWVAYDSHVELYLPEQRISKLITRRGALLLCCFRTSTSI